MKKYKFHKVVDIFPLLEPGDMAALRGDIERHGVIEPIKLWGDQVIDGRNRLTVWRELGRADEDIPAEQWDGQGSLIQYVVSLNMNRRHLTPSQRAACAAEATGLFQAEARARQAKGQFQIGTGRADGPGQVATTDGGPAELRARDQAAELFGASGRSTGRAEAVLKVSPEIHQRVKQGEITVSQGERAIRRQERLDRLNEAAAGVRPIDLERGWSIHHGDVVKVLSRMPDGSARLIFADPPYNQGVDYGSGPDADLKTADEYMKFCQSWMVEARRVLSDDGSFWVLISEDYADWFGIWLRLAGFTRRRWIVVTESFGQDQAENFSKCARHLFYCVKNKGRYIWNFNAVAVTSARLERGDARAYPDGKAMPNVWEMMRLLDNHPERLPGIPTQLPVALLMPIVGVASLPGDTVVDLFSGTGSFGEAALTQPTGPRKFIGIDNNEEYVKLSSARLSRVVPTVPVPVPEPAAPVGRGPSKAPTGRKARP